MVAEENVPHSISYLLAAWRTTQAPPEEWCKIPPGVLASGRGPRCRGAEKDNLLFIENLSVLLSF